jgi:hypothetical protein
MYSLEKSSEYLNWRYCRDFAGEYIKFIARIDGKTAGYAVVSINIESPMNIVFTVADCCYDSIETGYALLENISNLFDDSNSNVLRMLIPKGHPLERISAEYGMWNTRIHYYMNYIRKGDYTEDELKLQDCRPDQIMFASGDIDSV